MVDNRAEPGTRCADPAARPASARAAGKGALLWAPGLAVALAAGIATAHGVYDVAIAARVPTGIAWLYPLITDGLALVAYSATTRLREGAARYAWAVVVTAAGLSGLAQAAYLAGGPTVEVAPVLRFGVGAWPAIAAAVVAHLLYLLATAGPTPARDIPPATAPDNPFAPAPVQPDTVQPDTVQPDTVQPDTVQPDTVQPAAFTATGVQPEALPGGVQPPRAAHGHSVDRKGVAGVGGGSPSAVAPRAVPSPARDRAEAAAARHAQRHGAWPTVTELETAAAVSRGTAAAALKALRDHPLPLHLINTESPDSTDEAHP